MVSDRDKKSIQNDLKFGEKNECKIQPLLERKFKCKLKKTTDEFGVIDFSNDEEGVYIELKTRRNKHNCYKEGVRVGYNKIVKMSKMKHTKKKYVCFNCLDGVYVRKYHKKLLKYEKIKQKRMDRDGDGSWFILIKIENLRRIGNSLFENIENADYIMPFGKYKNKRIGDIGYNTLKYYLDWSGLYEKCRVNLQKYIDSIDRN